MFAQRIITKHQPTLVLVCGTWGKSLFAQTAKTLLSRLDQSLIAVDVTSDLRSAVAATAGGRFGSFLAAFGMKKVPGMHLFEFHADSDARRELLDSYEKRYLVIPFISAAEIDEAGGVEKYLQRRCYLNKKRAKETQVIFNADVPGLKEALIAIGVESLHGFTLRDNEAELAAVSTEYKIPEDAAIINDYRVQGMLFKARNGGSTLPMRISGGIGDPYLCTQLALLEFIRLLDLNVIDSLNLFREAPALPGRAKLIPGIKRSLLIDDSYDMDLQSALTFYQTSSEIPLQKGQRRIAVVGDLVHGGAATEGQHCVIGNELASMKYDAIVGVGERVVETLHCAVSSGFSEQTVFHFTDKIEAGKFIQHELRQGDLVVVKGAREQKLESIVKELMAFPLKAKEDLLQR